jgi:diguanylate cyclase (GGDEF)-like protein
MDRIPAGSALARILSFGIGLLLSVVVASVDVATGYEINLGLFYLVPIFVVTWWVGRGAGIALGAACVIGMFVVDQHVTRDIPFPSHQFIPYWNAAIRLGYFIVFSFVLSSLKRAHDREKRFAREDFLTGLANSQSFYEAVREAITRAGRSKLPLSIVYLDCDNFKEVNDRFGHGEGDRVLRKTAAVMRLGTRGVDLAARLGGDEFAVLLSEADGAMARRIVEKLQADLASMARQHNWPVTFSIGAITFLTPPRDPEHAIRESDSAMYEVKNSGKNSVTYRVLPGAPRADRGGGSAHW